MLYSANHEPKYSLDNDPDTYWQPSVYTTSALYFDLGDSISVDAIVMWLHNYNENYQNDKAWKISYSTDDITYIEFSEKTFTEYRTEYTPIVIDMLSAATSARYWRIEFLYFDSLPQTIRPEISCVWFMNDYSLPWKHQRPETNKMLYHNNETITQSGHRFTSPTDIGRQRVIQRQFIFTDDTNQWTNLNNAYHAARGGNLPIVMRSELNSDDYYALQFDTPLGENRQEHELWTPMLKLRELGHEHIPFQDKSLIQPNHNSAIYHFRDNAVDSGLNVSDTNKRDWNENNSPTYSADGIAEQNTTVINLAGTADLSITALKSTWANMGTDNFTIEAWFRGIDGVCLCRKTDGEYNMYDELPSPSPQSPLPSPLPSAGFFMGVYNQKLCLSIYDGSDGANLGSTDFSNIITGTSIGASDNEWHYVVMVVDRTNNLMHGYIDGSIHAQVDISNVVGSLSDINQPLECGVFDKDELYIDELTISPGYAMSAQEITNRFSGRINYGNWGM